MRIFRLITAIAALLPLGVSPAVGQTTAELFVDFDAAVDGDGTQSSPWNTLVGKPIEGAQDVTIWMQGEATPLEVPFPIAPVPGSELEALRLKSRHLVDPSAPRAHFTRGMRVSELETTDFGGGIFRMVYPSQAGFVRAVLRGWEVPGHRPIPPEGLEPGLAFDRDYAESFRVTESADVALPQAGSFSELEEMPYGFVPFNGSFYVKTPSGDAPGTGAEPEYRVVLSNASQQAFISLNALSEPRTAEVEIAGLIVSLQLRDARRRTMQVNPGKSVTVRDCLFVACMDDDNIAVVNEGGPEQHVRMLRNQHIGVGADGGPIVVSTQGGNPAYGSLTIRDQVVHFGYRINTLDGEDIGLASNPRFGLGAFHGGKVDRTEVERCIALSYNSKNIVPGQFPADPVLVPADPRDAEAMPIQIRDVYLEAVDRTNDFNFNGAHVSRSFFGRSHGQINQLFKDLSPAVYSSCLFEVQGRYAALGNISSFSTAFVNCTVRVEGRDDIALFGVTDGGTGSVYLRDLVVERVDGEGSLRLANSRDGYGTPPFRPDAILGWDGTPDLGVHWFGPGTLNETPDSLQSPAFATTPASFDEFAAVHGDGLRFGPTGAESLPGRASPAEVAAAYAGGVVGPQSDFATGPTGLNGQGYSARLGAFQTSHPDACSMGDIASPFGVLDLADIDGFVAAFGVSADEADLAAPPGVLDVSDIDRFIGGFVDGCAESW